MRLRCSILVCALSSALLCTAVAAAQSADPWALPYFEIVLGDAALEDPLPMVIALHGRGDRPEEFARRMPPFSEPVRLVVVRAPHERGGGWHWFEAPPVLSARAVASPVSASVPRLAHSLARIHAERPTIGRPILTGFSQGAILTYALAVGRPDRYAAAFPVAGLLTPNTLRAIDPGQVPPIVAFHGTADRVVPIDDDRSSVVALRQRGVNAVLREQLGLGHAMSRIVKRDLASEISAAIAVEREDAVRRASLPSRAH